MQQMKDKHRVQEGFQNDTLNGFQYQVYQRFILVLSLMNYIYSSYIQTTPNSNFIMSVEQKKIENFTDRIFHQVFSSNQQKKRHSLRSKTISSANQKVQLGLNSISKIRQRTGQNDKLFQRGLSKGDIEKLQLMNSHLSGEDYIRRLIKIHEDEKIYKRQAVNVLKQFQHKQEEDKSDENENDQQEQQEQKCEFMFQNQIELSKEDSGYKLLITSSEGEDRIRQIETSEKWKKSNKMLKRAPLQILDVEEVLMKNYSGKSKKNEFKIKEKKEDIFFQYENTKLMVPSINILETQLSSSRTKQGSLQQKQNQFCPEENYNTNKELQQMCYTQIGKRLVVVSEKEIKRRYFKSNLHIRSYVMKTILSYIQYLAEFSQNTIFILPNQKALHFQPNQKPPELSNYLQHTKYAEIIKNVNHIIQKNIYKQKYQQQSPSYWPFAFAGMFLFLVLLMCSNLFIGEDFNIKNAFMICSGFFICVILLVLISYSIHCFNMQIDFTPVCDIIQRDIRNYFKFINGKMENDLEWNIGDSFFWIQLKIRVKKEEREDENKKKRRSSVVFNMKPMRKNSKQIIN